MEEFWTSGRSTSGSSLAQAVQVVRRQQSMADSSAHVVQFFEPYDCLWRTPLLVAPYGDFSLRQPI